MDNSSATNAPKPQAALLASQEEMPTAVEAAAPEPEAATPATQEVSARSSAAVKRLAIKPHAAMPASQAMPSELTVGDIPATLPASPGSSARGLGLPPSQSTNPVLIRTTHTYTGAARPSSYTGDLQAEPGMFSATQAEQFPHQVGGDHLFTFKTRGCSYPRLPFAGEQREKPRKQQPNQFVVQHSPFAGEQNENNSHLQLQPSSVVHQYSPFAGEQNENFRQLQPSPAVHQYSPFAGEQSESNRQLQQSPVVPQCSPFAREQWQNHRQLQAPVKEQHKNSAEVSEQLMLQSLQDELLNLRVENARLRSSGNSHRCNASQHRSTSNRSKNIPKVDINDLQSSFSTFLLHCKALKITSDADLFDAALVALPKSVVAGFFGQYQEDCTFDNMKAYIFNSCQISFPCHRLSTYRSSIKNIFDLENVAKKILNCPQDELTKHFMIEAAPNHIREKLEKLLHLNFDEFKRRTALILANADSIPHHSYTARTSHIAMPKESSSRPDRGRNFAPRKRDDDSSKYFCQNHKKFGLETFSCEGPECALHTLTKPRPYQGNGPERE